MSDHNTMHSADGKSVGNPSLSLNNPNQALVRSLKDCSYVSCEVFRATMQTHCKLSKIDRWVENLSLYENNPNQMVKISEQPPQAILFKRDMQAIFSTPDF